MPVRGETGRRARRGEEERKKREERGFRSRRRPTTRRRRQKKKNDMLPFCLSSFPFLFSLSVGRSDSPTRGSSKHKQALSRAEKRKGYLPKALLKPRRSGAGRASEHRRSVEREKPNPKIRTAPACARPVWCFGSLLRDASRREESARSSQAKEQREHARVSERAEAKEEKREEQEWSQPIVD